MSAILDRNIEVPAVTSKPGGLMGEGNTPLVRSTSIAGRAPLFFKMEQLNPTGSFKDRFAAVESEVMKQNGIQAFIATSSGNTGAALSAYAARLGLRCLLFVNEVTPASKLNQMLVYGAEVYQVRGFGVTRESSAAIFERLQELAAEGSTRLVISAYKYSPLGMDGLKAIASEIVQQFGGVPDHVFVPVGGGGLLSGIWGGFRDLKDRGSIDRLPKIVAVQPELNDTVVTSINSRSGAAREVSTTTAISGLAVQVDIDASRAVGSVDQSGGFGVLVSDEFVIETQALLARNEGIFVEPAGAVSTAGYIRAIETGRLGRDDSAVCILTGHGLKSAQSEDSLSMRPAEVIGIGDIDIGLLAKN